MSLFKHFTFLPGFLLQSILSKNIVSGCLAQLQFQIQTLKQV